jgi:hypothetical protein
MSGLSLAPSITRWTAPAAAPGFAPCADSFDLALALGEQCADEVDHRTPFTDLAGQFHARGRRVRIMNGLTAQNTCPHTARRMWQAMDLS